jgi:hypothetical protein
MNRVVEASATAWSEAVLGKQLDGREGAERLASLARELKSFDLGGDLPSSETPQNASGGRALSEPLLSYLLASFRVGLMRLESSQRANIFRCVRYLLHGEEHVKAMLRQRIDIFIVRGLERDQHELWERMQTLKLVRRIVEISPEILPRGIVRSLVTVLANKEDNFRRVCIETVRLLASANPKSVAQVNGFRWLLQAVADPTARDLVDPVVSTITLMLEDPETRKYLRPRLDLHALLAGFTELDSSALESSQQDQSALIAKSALVALTRSWAGIILLVADPDGLPALMKLMGDCSEVRGEEMFVQESILDTVRTILSPFIPFGSRRGLSSFTESDGSVHEGPSPPSLPNQLHARGAFLCAALVHCGLISNLVRIGIYCAHMPLRRKACHLLIEVLRLCCVLLSPAQCATILTFPELAAAATTPSMLGQLGGLMTTGESGATDLRFRTAGALHEQECAARAGDLIRLIDSAVTISGPSHFFGPQFRLALPSSRRSSKPFMMPHGSPVSTMVGGERFAMDEPSGVSISWFMEQWHESKWDVLLNEGGIIAQSASRHHDRSARTDQRLMTLRMQRELMPPAPKTDAATELGTLIAKSRVLITKDWGKWDWDAIDEMVQGPLRFAPQLAETLRTKWVKRVAGFFRFFGHANTPKGGLHTLRWDPEGLRYVRVGLRLFGELLGSPEGIQFLHSDRRGLILEEIVKELLVPSSKAFDMDSCQKRLSVGYAVLAMGVTSRHEEGCAIMQSEGLWSTLRKLINDREYLVRMFIAGMDCRAPIASSDRYDEAEFIDQCLQSPSVSIPMYALNVVTSRLRVSLGANGTGDPVAAPKSLSSDESAAMKALMRVMKSTSVAPSVHAAAVAAVSEFCSHRRWIRQLVVELSEAGGGKDQRASFDGRLTASFAEHLLSIPEGLSLLQQRGWVETAVSMWQQSGMCERYSEDVLSALETKLRVVQEADDDVEETASENSTGPVSIPIVLKRGHDELFGGWQGQGMQLLLRLPWNIEIVLSRDAAPRGLSLRVDTYVDTAPPPTSGQAAGAGVRGDHGGSRLVRIRGVLVDSHGKPTCHPIEPHLVLHARLCIGTCVVDRWGTVQQPLGAGNSSAGFSLDKGFFGTSSNNNTEDEWLGEQVGAWSTCHPRQRQSFCRTEPKLAVSSHYEGEQECVCVPNETAQFIFSRSHRDRPQSTSLLSSLTPKPSKSGTGSVAFLQAAEFTLSLECDGPGCVALPPHLYGQLAETDEGCRLLTTLTNIQEMLQSLRGDCSVAIAGNVRVSHAHCLGHISSRRAGLESLLQIEPSYPRILTRACLSDVNLAVRRACFDAVALMAMTSRGRTLLTMLGWESARDSSSSFMIPSKLESLFSAPSWKYEGSPADSISSSLDPLRAEDGLSAKAVEFLHLLAKMGCPVTSKEAKLKLARLRRDKSYKGEFSSVPLLLRAHDMLQDYELPLHVRRYAFDILEEVPWNGPGWPEPTPPDSEE